MTIPQFVAGSVLEAAQLNVIVDALNAGGGKMEVQQFTASGTFTVPAGVTHAVAHITGGGGGVGTASSGTGGTSSVAFAGGTISATGGVGINNPQGASYQTAMGQPVNSGYGATLIGAAGTVFNYNASSRNDGAVIVAGGAVTPAEDIAITVGAGGAAGTSTSAAGASGYVWIEYQV